MRRRRVSAQHIGDWTRLAAHVGRGAQRIATDAVVGRARAFPRRIQDLDAAALSAIMGRPICSVSIVGDTNGTTTRARLALKGDEVPDSVFVKMAARATGTRLIGELGRLGETEIRFYRQLSPELASGVPTHLGSAFDSLTGRFVLVLEDLAARQGQRLTFWGRLGDGPFNWLYSGSGDPTVPLVPAMLRTSARRLASRTDLAVDEGDFINERYPAVARAIDAAPHTVLHGDAHPGNTYFRDGKAGLLDWQAVRRGHPMRDIPYTLVTSMTTADRQACQRELLDTYRHALTAAGGPELEREQLWLHYRQAAAYAYVAATITAGLGGMQSNDIALAGLRLAIAAVADLETVAALRKVL